MTASRPPFTLMDIPFTVIFAFLGAFLGAGTVGALVMLFQGGWVVLLILIGIFIFQAIGQGILHLIIWAFAAVWALLRGRPLPTRPPSISGKYAPVGPQPWLKDHAFTIGFVAAFAFVLYSAWRTGGFSNWGLL